MSDEEEAQVEVKPAEPILIAEFEGDYVRDFEGKLPALSMIMPEGYARGTHLKLQIEVRIRNVRYEEKSSKKNERPELVRQHMFALEEIQLLGAYTPEEMDPGVGGSAAASAVDVVGVEDLGMTEEQARQAFGF